MSVISTLNVESTVSYRRDELRSPCRGDAGWSHLSKHLSSVLLPQHSESRGRGGGQSASEDSYSITNRLFSASECQLGVRGAE